MKNKHIGSNFDDFLQDEGLLVETEATAINRVLVFQIQKGKGIFLSPSTPKTVLNLTSLSKMDGAF